MWKIFMHDIDGTLWSSAQNSLPIYWKLCIAWRYEILRALVAKSKCFETVPCSISPQQQVFFKCVVQQNIDTNFWNMNLYNAYNVI